MTNIRWKALLWQLALPLGVGLLAGLITRENMAVYGAIVKPPFAPPAILFPIVWTLLYVLMGVSSYRIDKAPRDQKAAARAVYYLQLIVNFFWPILFFNKRAFLLSFFWLLLLWALILVMIVRFYKLDRIAGLLQIPYGLWVTFAGILNFSVYWLNR